MVFCVCYCSILVFGGCSFFLSSEPIIISTYLFLGGVMCAIAFFSSFSWSPGKMSNLVVVLPMVVFFSSFLLENERWVVNGALEFGVGWESLAGVLLVCIFALLLVVVFVFDVFSSFRGGLRFFSF